MTNLEGVRQIGTIAKAHGIKGDLKVRLETSDPTLHQRLDHVILIKGESRQSLPVKGVKEFKDGWLMRLEGVGDKNAADELKDEALYLEEELLTPLEPDEFYVDDLIGLKVYSTEGEYLGEIQDYFETGGQGVCEVGLDKKSFLFPVTNEVVKEIDPQNNKVVVHVLEGLLEP